MESNIIVIGGGLAGTEAALQLAKKGFKVDLYEMRPKNPTPIHKTDMLAEFVCSNSLGSKDTLNASGLLKKELEILGSYLIKTALEVSVPAGGALAIDRVEFSKKITDMINTNKNINLIREEITEIPEERTPCIIASGPLTSKKFAENIKGFTGENHLNFSDAVAPIVEKASINFEKAFYASRYDKGDADYINCPMNKNEYDNFYEILINAPKAELKNFEKEIVEGHKENYFESCLPIEVLAARGKETLCFGPLKPVGLIDKRTNEKNYAVVQLRQDDLKAELYNLVGFQTNLKWGAQKELIQSIPGLEFAEIVRYGVMHRNIYINSPQILLPTFQARKRENLLFAGQITGTEGYTESIAGGTLAGINLARILGGKQPLTLPKTTILGALTDYITFEGHKNFQPVNSNWGIISLPEELQSNKKLRKDKKLKSKLLSERSITDLETYLSNNE